MLRTVTAVLLLGMTTAVFAQPAAPARKKMTTNQQKASYAIGLDIGRNFVQNNITLDPDLLAEGIRDALTKAKPRLTDKELAAATQAFEDQLLLNRMPEKMKAQAIANGKKGAEYLARNGKREGVVTLPSGLQYEVLKKGSGTTPKATDAVKVHYHGTLIDGTVFDSSVDRKQPATFPVSGVIAGWVEALQLMPVGSKWRLYIPPNLAYRVRGSGPKIGPNETLVFETELLEIVKPGLPPGN